MLEELTSPPWLSPVREGSEREGAMWALSPEAGNWAFTLLTVGPWQPSKQVSRLAQV